MQTWEICSVDETVVHWAASMGVTSVGGWVESMVLSTAEYSAAYLVGRKVAMWVVWTVASTVEKWVYDSVVPWADLMAGFFPWESMLVVPMARLTVALSDVLTVARK